jgi:hemolysin activation/secretion protein
MNAATRRGPLLKNVCAVTLFIAFSIPSPLYPQSQIEKSTRELDRLGKKEAVEEQLRKIPEKPSLLKPEEAAAREGEKRFFVKRIELSGCESVSPKDFSSIVALYEAQEVTMSQLDALAKEIEQEYLRRGIIAAVFPPPQEIKDQTVTLRVVEARMGQLQIEDHKYFNKMSLTRYWTIPPGEILRYEKISKSVQMMNKNPDREVKAVLHAGAKPGTTDVLLTPKTRFPIHFTGSADNEGSVPTGRWRTNLGGRDNNLLGLDDILLAGYIFGEDFSGLYGYHNVPITSCGTSVLYGYNRSEASPKKDFENYGINSQAENASLSLRQDLYQKDSYMGEVFAEFDAKDKTITTFTGTYNRDRLRIISVGGNFVWRGLEDITFVSPELSQGVEAFGATKKDNAMASRGAPSTFTKFGLGVQHKRFLPLGVQLMLKFKTQCASAKLTPQEEFGLGGIDSVRGYPASDYQADNAVLTNAELLIPMFFLPKKVRLPYSDEPLRNQITPLAFIDYGWGSRRGAFASNDKRAVNYVGVGTGVRIRLFDQVLVRLEWGFPIGDDAITESALSRFHFSVEVQEKLPELLGKMKADRKK